MGADRPAGLAAQTSAAGRPRRRRSHQRQNLREHFAFNKLPLSKLVTDHFCGQRVAVAHASLQICAFNFAQ